MVHACDLCGRRFDYSQLNSQDKLVLDPEGKWKRETTYRCFDCAKEAVLGKW